VLPGGQRDAGGRVRRGRLARGRVAEHATDEVDERLGRQGCQLGRGHAASWAEIKLTMSMASVAIDWWSTAVTGVNGVWVTVVPLG
jgi:hypothetical protein